MIGSLWLLPILKILILFYFSLGGLSNDKHEISEKVPSPVILGGSEESNSLIGSKSLDSSLGSEGQIRCFSELSARIPGKEALIFWVDYYFWGHLSSVCILF